MEIVVIFKYLFKNAVVEKPTIVNFMGSSDHQDYTNRFPETIYIRWKTSKIWRMDEYFFSLSVC